MYRMAPWIALATLWLGPGTAGIGQDDAPTDRLRALSSLHSQRFANPGSGAAGFGQFQGGGLDQRAGAAGGASLANYSELMRLIESVIDAPWANNGGTATMFPFRNGVRIDPQGLIQRLDEVDRIDAPALRLPSDRLNRSTSVVRLDSLGDWQQTSSMRWISLHQLDDQLTECLEKNQSANIAMELLGGLCRIDYVAFDPSCNEWLIGGPAGNVAADAQGVLLHNELRLPPILLEDLLTVAPHVFHQRGEFGCSIDPVQERLVAAYKMAQSPTAIRDLRSDPDHWATEWKSKLGKQRTNMIGLPDDSPTGYALLIADAHMKRIALGLEPAPDGLANYWLEADSISQVDRGPMVRWWFTLSDARIPWDPERKIAHFPLSNVRVLSESQMLDSQGARVVADRPDWAADAFARNFTSKFEALQRSHAAYGRLRHIFDLAVALEIVRSQIQAGHGKPFQSLNRFELQPHLPVAPKEIDSVVATRRFSDGGVSAIVSGGVTISPRATVDRLRRSTGQFDAIAIETSPGEREEPRDGHEKPFWR
jgi:hypothetical protein